MKVVFAVPPYQMNGYHVPYGISIVATVAKKAGLDVSVYPSTPTDNLNYYNQRLLEYVKANSVEVVAIGGMSPDYLQIKKLLSLLAQNGITTILGGYIVDANPKLIAGNIGADFCVFGEGEYTFIELVERLEAKKEAFGDIAGLVFVDDDGELVQTAARENVTDLDELPFIDGGLCHWETSLQFDSSLFLMLSRSCPYQCTFCYHLKGSKYRAKSLNYVFTELDYYFERYGNQIQRINVQDDLFNVDKARVLEFCRRIKGYNRPFWVSTRIEFMDDDTLAALKDAGAYMASYGLESASNKVLKSMKKNLTIEQATEILEATVNHGLGLQANLIIGDIADDTITIKESEDYFLRHFRDWDLNIQLIRLFPGTGLYEYALKNGIITNELDFLEKGCPYTNVSQLTDEHYSILQDRYSRLSWLKNVMNRKPFISKNPEFNIHKDGSVDCEVICTKCHSRVSYKDFDLQYHRKPYAGDRYVGCPRCGQRLHLHTIDLFSISLDMSYLIGNLTNVLLTPYIGKRIAIWGMTTTIRWMILESHILRDSIIAVVDSDYQNKSGERYCGLRVEKPEVLRDTEFDYLLTPTTARRAEIVSMLTEFGIEPKFIEFDYDYINKNNDKRETAQWRL
jgi:radical SAM superfamily enzyme YgiQ (UPF0313 family)